MDKARMVWYPTTDDIIKANSRAVRDDKHPPKLRRSIKAIRSLIDDIRLSESKGFIYQAARFLKELITLHAFDGGNHRTAYSTANLFLVMNGIKVRTVPSTVSYPFVRAIPTMDTGEVEEWIRENMIELQGGTT